MWDQCPREVEVVTGAGPEAEGRGLGRIRWIRLNYLLLLGVSFAAMLLAWRYWYSNLLHGGFPRLWPLSSKVGKAPPPVVEFHDSLVGIMILSHASVEGAVCLDGSPPAYFMAKGFGEGAKNWFIYLESGRWCNSHENYLERSLGQLGSSKYMEHKMQFIGALDNTPWANPDFYNWNHVFVKYCDGGSFNGDMVDPVNAFTATRFGNRKVYYRGQRIWTAVMKDLLSKGMDKVEKAFLLRSSAGGLATILHCDQFHDLLPQAATVKCLSDAGFFIHVSDVFGKPTMEEYYADIVNLQRMGPNLPQACTSKMNETLCFFPEYLIADMRTPIFLLNSGYDTWQFTNALVPFWLHQDKVWVMCIASLYHCTELVLQKFRQDLLGRLQLVLTSKKDGAFIDSCYLHAQTYDNVVWGGPKIDGKSIANAVGDWYFGRNMTNLVDCPFPCNPTCPF